MHKQWPIYTSQVTMKKIHHWVSEGNLTSYMPILLERVTAAELFNYWITQMKIDAEKKKGFSPEEKKQREGELLVWIRNNWHAKRHRKKVADNGGWLHRIGYQTVLPRMDAYKECIEKYANQYLEAGMLGE
ncbi:hypothetical protein BDN71DRAFT_1435908 [Pleurotus eryngii]|uniref:Uncharacterized protein n=1 Tax=Pleurotus eryngii TaxID=5323 RepID=A0A9P5ZKI1_PLEER|nr:hypothetical protein BDN71DRAFT_1435908 [Pleurotus eryngii]